MADYTNDVLKKLNENNCTFLRHGKGDHNIWHSSVSGKNFPVDGSIRDRHLANKVMKDAGINYKF